jgi:hypothetical protein
MEQMTLLLEDRVLFSHAEQTALRNAGLTTLRVGNIELDPARRTVKSAAT